MEIKQLVGEDIVLRWDVLKPKIDQALLHGAGSTDSYLLLLQCLDRRAQCWISEDEFGTIHAVAITRIECYDTFNGVAIVAAYCPDKLKYLMSNFLSKIEDFAQMIECKRVIIYGRRGWLRQLKNHGYSEPYTVVSKEV